MAAKKRKKRRPQVRVGDTNPDWSQRCIVCDATPILPATEMCGPCTFGEAETIGGNW